MLTIPLVAILLVLVVCQVWLFGGRMFHALCALLLGMLLSGTAIGAPIQAGLTSTAGAVSAAIVGMVH